MPKVPIAPRDTKTAGDGRLDIYRAFFEVDQLCCINTLICACTKAAHWYEYAQAAPWCFSLSLSLFIPVSFRLPVLMMCGAPSVCKKDYSSGRGPPASGMGRSPPPLRAHTPSHEQSWCRASYPPRCAGCVADMHHHHHCHISAAASVKSAAGRTSCRNNAGRHSRGGRQGSICSRRHQCYGRYG